MRNYTRSPGFYNHDSSDSSTEQSDSESLIQRPQQAAKRNKKHSKGNPRKTQKNKSHKSSGSAPHADNDLDASDSDSKPEVNPKLSVLSPCKVVNYILLLKEKEAVKKGELEESEVECNPSKQRDRYQQAYDTFIDLAPALKELVNNPKKRDELQQILAGMKRIITSVRSNDCARLKERIGRYIPVNPTKDIITPPIHDSQRSRSHLGFNHPVLTCFLCPIEHVKDYDDDPDGTHQKLLNGRIKVTSDVFPAFIWAGETSGVNFNDDNMLEGMFEGYFLARVMRHIFRGASSAFGEEPTGSRSCNAELHEMSKVVAPNIAYACLQARFNISSKNRWSEKDGAFNYRNFYYAVLDIIEDCADKEWTDSLLRFHNHLVFGNENGHEDTDLRDGSGEKSSGSSGSFLARLRAQGEVRAKEKASIEGGDHHGHFRQRNNTRTVDDDAQGQARAKEKAGSEVGDGNAYNDVDNDTGGFNDHTRSDDDARTVAMTTVRNIGTSAFGSPVQVCFPPRFSTLPAGTTPSGPSQSACATRNGSTTTPSNTGRNSPGFGGETTPSPLTGSDEWSQAIARRARDKGEEWSKLAPTLAQGKGKRKAHVVSSSDEEAPTQVAEKQKKAPRRRKTRK